MTDKRKFLTGFILIGTILLILCTPIFVDNIPGFGASNAVARSTFKGLCRNCLSNSNRRTEYQELKEIGNGSIVNHQVLNRSRPLQRKRLVVGVVAGVVGLTGVVGGLVGGLVRKRPVNNDQVVVRAEDVNSTLIAQQTTILSAGPVAPSNDASHSCSGTSVAGALSVVTKNQWSGTWYPSENGFLLTAIKGVKHDQLTSWWTYWVNYHEVEQSICQTQLSSGDSVLFFVQNCDPEYQSCKSPVLPLGLIAPTTVTVGQPFIVRVRKFLPDGTSIPVQGVSINGGSAEASSDSAGQATLTISQPGRVELSATKVGLVKSAPAFVIATQTKHALDG